MGNVIFWILFVLLIVTLVATTRKHERDAAVRELKKMTQAFGDGKEHEYPTDRFDSSPSLFEHLKSCHEDRFVIDDITANDLALRDVYSRMNSCVTSAGSDYLYCMFRMHASDDDAYESIKQYINYKDLAVLLISILARYRLTGKGDQFVPIKQLINAENKSPVVDIIPLAGLIAAFVVSAFYPLVGIVSVIVMIIVCIALYFGGKSSMDDNLRALSLSLRLIECAKDLSDNGCKAFDRYRKLYSLKRGNFLLPYKDQSTSNPLSVLFDYVRMITHVDIIIYKLKISKIRSKTEELSSLFIEIGKLDAYIAVASYLIPRSHCEASVTSDHSIKAGQLYHPLIKDPVCNDFETDKGVVVTGSNASGKSTFLKAVGLNVLFAENFGFAFANSFETGAFNIFTSMALNDNILGGESYYVVEARSIKRICDAAQNGNCLCIIDEVLRGTNTVERIAASTRILQYLCRPTVLCIAATHDLELTKLLENDMDCYYFTEEISEDQVTFPFSIMKGVSNKTNAIRLLAMLGFDKELVASADALVAKYKSSSKWVDEK